MHYARKASLNDLMNLSASLIPIQQMGLETPDNPLQNSAHTRHSARACVLKYLCLASMLLLAAGAQAQAVFATWQNIGTTATQTVTVTASAAGTVSTVAVLTNGQSGLEFTAGSGASTCGSAALTVGATCTQSVTFTPAYPGLRTGAVELLDGNKNVLGTAYLSGVGQGGLDVLVPGNIIPVAGVFEQVVSTKNGIPATTANLKQPASVVLDGAGNVYLSDSAHNEVRMVCFSATSATIAGVTCPGAGIIIDIAGTGGSGYTGDGDPASSPNVTLASPTGLGIDGAGNLYIADSGNNVVRKITAATGIITTVAGDGSAWIRWRWKPATASGVELNDPQGVTIDAYGDINIADTYNQRIRRVDAVTRIITTIAGDGDPSGAGDGRGNLRGHGGPANAAGLSLPLTRCCFRSLRRHVHPRLGQQPYPRCESRQRRHHRHQHHQFRGTEKGRATAAADAQTGQLLRPTWITRKASPSTQRSISTSQIPVINASAKPM